MKKNPVIFILYLMKSAFLIVWIVFSSILYGFLCLLIGGFSEKISWWITIRWSKNLAFFSGVKVVTHGLEKLDPSKNYLFISNHLSYSDIVVIFLGIPYKLSFIARKNIFYVPIWGWAIYLAGHIPVDRSHPKKARKSIERASITIKKNKRSIFGFPEGTRSKTGEMGPFKLGLFSLAIQTRIDIVPITIHGTRSVLKKGSLFIHSGTVHLEIADPISVEGYTQRNKNELALKARNIIQACVEKEKKEQIYKKSE